MARFVIATDKMPAVIADRLTTHFKGTGWGFWHWLDDFWVLDGVPDIYTAKKLYEELDGLSKLFGAQTCVVMRTDPPLSFWGAATKDCWPWMSKYWGEAK